MSNSIGPLTSVQDLIDAHDYERPSAEELATLQLRQNISSGFNISYFAKGARSRWFVKYCRHSNNLVLDICEREVCTSLFGRWLNIPTVKSWTIPTNDIPSQVPVMPWIIRDRCVVMEYIAGGTLVDLRVEASRVINLNKEAIANLFAFIHWIGDEDRGLQDVMLVEDKIMLIDNGLCCPARRPLLRGAHPEFRVYQQHHDALVKKCFPGKPSLVAFVIRDIRVQEIDFREPHIIDVIESLNDDDVVRVVKASGLSHWVGDDLNQRRPLLRQSYHEWLAEACRLLSVR